MILISGKEKNAVLEEFPKLHIVRTAKQRSKRHRYYMVEDTGAMRLLRKLRGEPEEPKKNQRPKRRRWN